MWTSPQNNNSKSAPKKLYIISGLGADFSVLKKLSFPAGLQIVFLDWLMPNPGESFQSYVQKMADRIDDSQPFYLLGYSFGGIMVQEIDQLKPAEKVVILGSIKSDKEKSRLIKWGEFTNLPKYLPVKMFNTNSAIMYGLLRKIFNPRNPHLMTYFTVRDSYYLKWSIEKIAAWKFKDNGKTIQILADNDVVFPIKYSHPQYVVKGASHLFPLTKHKEVSEILAKIFKA